METIAVKDLIKFAMSVFIGVVATLGYMKKVEGIHISWMQIFRTVLYATVFPSLGFAIGGLF